jgi:hypothetical protein
MKIVDHGLQKILILSDGKKGHLNQSFALAKALCLGDSSKVATLEVANKSLIKVIKEVAQYVKLNSLSYIIAAGRKTHLSLILCRLMFSVKTIVLMTPQYPLSLFDWCVVPEHDGVKNKHNVIHTVGTLNDIRPVDSSNGDYDLVLVGGCSKEFSWNDQSVFNQIMRIRELTSSNVIVSGSRRTPTSFFDFFKGKNFSSMECLAVDELGPNWYSDHLLAARRVWVTMDSVNMIYEALSAGKFVGVIELPVVKKGRVFRGFKGLLDRNWIRPLSQLNTDKAYLNIVLPELREAKRVAEIILNG